MRVRHSGPEALTLRGSAAEPGHLGAGAGLVDEHEPRGVKIGLAVEPSLTLLQDVGTILLRGVRGLFFTVIFRRAKKRHRLDTATATPLSANSTRSSTKVMSGLASTA